MSFPVTWSLPESTNASSQSVSLSCNMSQDHSRVSVSSWSSCIKAVLIFTTDVLSKVHKKKSKTTNIDEFKYSIQLHFSTVIWNYHQPSDPVKLCYVVQSNKPSWSLFIVKKSLEINNRYKYLTHQYNSNDLIFQLCIKCGSIHVNQNLWIPIDFGYDS